MKITKFVHACLLIEMPAPINRTALFDPGTMSEQALDVAALQYLDDIFITHEHADHLSLDLLKQLVAKFPDVRITGAQAVVDILAAENITASAQAGEGVSFFEAPHEDVEPLFPRPDNIGIHYLDLFSDPGDSHTFDKSKAVLALPITAPWGATVTGINLAIRLKPRYVIPVHDWHWSDVAQERMYDLIAGALDKEGITFLKLKTGVPQVIDV